MKKKKLYLETYGCQMNVHDSEKAIHALAGRGFEPTDDPFAADLILLNTCMVREKAARRVYARVSDLKGQIRQDKASRPTPERPILPIFGVMGCVAQAEAERLFERSPDIRLVLGTQAIGRLPEMVDQLESGFQRAIEVRLSKDAEFYELQAGQRQTSHVAFVTITEGCNKFCSYCIVPFTRGRERSRRADNIVDEVRALGEQGFREVQLLGQNVNSYGSSGRLHGSQPSAADEISFARLLERVATESGVARIKYTTSYPRDFDAEVVRVMDTHENLCEWIHLPAQSGSDRILRAMRRGYTFEDYLERIESIRRGQKDYAITGDIIIGFPGETEDDFNDTLRLVAEVEYDGLYIFNYSPRPRTPAAAYADSVPDEVKAERFARLQELQRRIQNRRYERYLGRTIEVLVEGESARAKTDLTGHSRCQKVVNFPGHQALTGSLVKVRVTGAKPNSLYGELVDAPELPPAATAARPEIIRAG
ncbi:MAG: tRNA (N6-isopentenyl adenosine(37)-C2)-methylthiotransferase MiaB [Acidobacteriota bacterium]